jgi:hypothetical protein
MGKYNHLKTLKQIKARAQHNCSECGREIIPGETYWKEQIQDKFLHNLHAKKYCVACHQNRMTS